MSNYKNAQMDWQQVVLNGGPPCFAQLDDEEGRYCGRAERWEGHDGEHKFVSLDNLLATIRQEERQASFRDALRSILNLPPQGTMNYRRGYEEGVRDAIRTLEAAAEHKEGALDAGR